MARLPSHSTATEKRSHPRLGHHRHGLEAKLGRSSPGEHPCRNYVAARCGERKWLRCETKLDAGIIEIEAEDVTIRPGCGADAAMNAAIVRALKASR